MGFFVYFCIRFFCLLSASCRTTKKKMVSIISHTRDTELFKNKKRRRKEKKKKLLKQVATMTKLECNSSQNISDCTRRVNNKTKKKTKRRRRERKKLCCCCTTSCVPLYPEMCLTGARPSRRTGNDRKEYYLFIYFAGESLSLSNFIFIVCSHLLLLLLLLLCVDEEEKTNTIHNTRLA